MSRDSRFILPVIMSELGESQQVIDLVERDLNGVIVGSTWHSKSWLQQNLVVAIFNT